MRRHRGAPDTSNVAYEIPGQQVLDPRAAAPLCCRARWDATREESHGEPAAAAELRIDVTGSGMTLSKARRERVRRRVLLAISRFDDVAAVRARISRSRTALGGVDVHCRAGARLRSGLKLEAEAIDGQVEAAVGRCAVRLALLVAAALDGDASRQRVPGRR